MTPPELLLHACAMSAGTNGVTILDDVSVEVGDGQIVGLFGANGAGKTSCLDAICGVLPLRAGRISIAGDDITALPAWRRVGFGMRRLFEDVRLFSRLTVLDNLLVSQPKGILDRPWAPLFLPSRLARAERSCRERADAVLEELGLADRADQAAGTLSAGDARLLAMGRLFIGSPAILLLDEPFAGQNASRRGRIVELLKRRAAAGVGILLVEHDYPLLRDLVHRFIVLRAGRKVLEGSAGDVTAGAISEVLG